MNSTCELRAVSKRYQNRNVIKDIDLTVNPGEMVAVVGKSGSGKSTLLNIIGLLETADSGTVRLFGQESPGVGSPGAMRLLRRRMAYLFQNYALIDNETVDYNLRIAQVYAKGSRGEKRERRDHAMRRVGLPSAGSRRVYELSGGEQQRVAVARILLKPCDLVLADEPTGSLDAVNSDEVLRMLHDLNESGKTIIVVTHDERVAAACTRVIELPDPARTDLGATAAT